MGLIQYNATSRAEFLRPFRQAQLDLYQQASSAAASLATLPRTDPAWITAKNDFLRLYYGPMAMVEDYRHGLSGDKTKVTVEQAMIAFKKCLDDAACPVLQGLSLGLAHTLRVSIGTSWGFEAEQLSGDYQKLINDYLEGPQ